MIQATGNICQTLKNFKIKQYDLITDIKGREGVEDAKSRLGLVPLHKGRDQRLSLLMPIIAEEEHHSTLSESYNDKLMNDGKITDT